MKVIFACVIKTFFLIAILFGLFTNCVYFAIYKDKPKCVFEEYYKGTVKIFKELKIIFI